MLRLSLNASVRNCFAAALTLHFVLMLLVVSSDHSSVNNVLVVPALDPNVRVVFSPFAGSARMSRGQTRASALHEAPQKEPAKAAQQKKGKAAVQSKKQKACAPKRAEKSITHAISRVAAPSARKQASKKPEPVKKQASVQKKQSKKEAAKKNTAPDSPKPSPAVLGKVIEKASEQQSVEPVPEEIVVGRSQYEEYRIAREIRSAIERTWVAPRGVDSEIRCVLAVEIDERGAVKTIETRTSSGSALFDSAARYAASQTCYPKEVWGKTLVVEFTP